MSSSSSRNRFADYFVICGLDLNSGLEPDLVAGNVELSLFVFHKISSKFPPLLIFFENTKTKSYSSVPVYYTIVVHNMLPVIRALWS